MSTGPTTNAAVLRHLATGLATRALVLVGVLAAVFAAIDRLPGNAARAILDRGASATDIAAAEQRLGLDQSLPVRFLAWLGHLLRGDFGTTAQGSSVADLLAARLPITLATSGVALVFVSVLSLAIAAWWLRWPSHPLARIWGTASTALVALPEFIVGTVLVLVFSLLLDVLPAVTLTGVDGRPDTLDMYVLPVATLALPQVAWNSRVIRSALADAAAMPHVRAAQLAGIGPSAVLFRHVLPLAAPTVALSLVTTSGMMIAGTVVVEALFHHPGVGSLVASAVQTRDAGMLAAVLAVTGALLLVLLTLTDLVRTATSTGGRP